MGWWSIFLLLTSFYFSANSSYVPGDKGAPWTEEEVPLIITLITVITMVTIVTTTSVIIRMKITIITCNIRTIVVDITKNPPQRCW